MTDRSDTVTSTQYDSDYDAWNGHRRPIGSAPEPASPSHMSSRRLAVLAAIIVLVGALAGVAAGVLMPKTYAARAELLYPITEELPTGFLREDRNLTTQLVVLRSRAVLGPVAAAEDVPLEQLESSVDISLLDSSEVIRIEVRDDSADVAKSLVDRIADTYLDMVTTDPDSSALKYVQSELVATETELAGARQSLNRLLELEAAGTEGLSDQIDEVSTEITDLRSRVQALRSERDEIQIIERSDPAAELITQPYVVRAPISPGPAILGAAGAMTGIVVAACVAAFVLRRRFRT